MPRSRDGSGVRQVTLGVGGSGKTVMMVVMMGSDEEEGCIAYGTVRETRTRIFVA